MAKNYLPLRPECVDLVPNWATGEVCHFRVVPETPPATARSVFFRSLQSSLAGAAASGVRLGGRPAGGTHATADGRVTRPTRKARPNPS